jgi:hypothetical protein
MVWDGGDFATTCALLDPADFTAEADLVGEGALAGGGELGDDCVAVEVPP